MAVDTAASYSHSELLNPSVLAFSDTARFVWSFAPLGKSACISTRTLTSAFGSATRRAMISSAMATSRNLAVAALTETLRWKDSALGVPAEGLIGTGSLRVTSGGSGSPGRGGTGGRIGG